MILHLIHYLNKIVNYSKSWQQLCYTLPNLLLQHLLKFYICKLNGFQGPELFSKYVGDSEKSVRELFKKAKQVAPCIIFIDEIETLGLDRSNLSNSGGGSVQERVLLQF